jgi:hypothetical protein
MLLFLIFKTRFWNRNYGSVVNEFQGLFQIKTGGTTLRATSVQVGGTEKALIPLILEIKILE